MAHEYRGGMAPEKRTRKLPSFEAGGIYKAVKKKKKSPLPRRRLRETLAAFLRRNRGDSGERQD